MNKKIAVVTGGNSSEYIISVKSADTIMENINSEKYDAYRVVIKGLDWSVVLQDGTKSYIDKNDFSFQLAGDKITFDAALIIIHGDPGEDGKLQGYFDMLNIPYTASNVLSSAATFSKHFTKQYLKSYGVSLTACNFQVNGNYFIYTNNWLRYMIYNLNCSIYNFNLRWGTIVFDN